MKAFIVLFLGMVVVFFSSCASTIQVAVPLNPQTNLFPANPRKLVNVTIDLPMNADTLRKMLVVQNSEYLLAMGQYMNFFERVLTVNDFEAELIRAGLAGEVSSLSSMLGAKRAYTLYQPFVILTLLSERRQGEGWFAKLRLYDPKTARVVFQNEIWLNLFWDGWSDRGTMFPLFNSLLEYLRRQENVSSKGIN